MVDNTTIGRRPITIIEIDQVRCTRTYGVAPCTAALGVTGDAKCYNGIKSCQDEDHFDAGTLTLRFCNLQETGLAKDAIIIPSLLKVDTVATELNIGDSNPNLSPLGSRAKISATLQDHPYADYLVDRYVATRGFDTAARGTFWSKWLARNPYYQGRPLRVREGYVGQTLAEMSVSNFIIERIDGPDSKGEVRITAKDPLTLLADNRATAPAPSSGVLLAGIDDNDLALTLSPTGVGNDEYPASGIARIGSELVSYTRSGDAITLTGRHLRGTAAAAASAGDLFQDVLVIDGVRVDLQLYDFLVNYAGIDPAFIDTDAWEAETLLWLAGFDLERWITEPTGINTLVAQIIQSAPLFIWWDAKEQQIQLRAVRPYYPLVDELAIEVDDDATIVADSLAIEMLPEERLSDIQVWWSQINPTGGVDEPSNYARFRSLIAQDEESANKYGEKRIKRIFCPYLGESGDAATLVLATRILERMRETPRRVTFCADAKDKDDLRAGRVIRMTTRGIVGLEGETEPTLMQITREEPVDPGHRIELQARPYLSRTRYGFIMENDAPDYGAASDAEKLEGCFIAASGAGFDNGDLPYRIL